MKRIFIVTAITAASWGLVACDKAPTTSTATTSSTATTVVVPKAKPASDTVAAKLDDAKIVTAVNAELLKDSELSALKINVDSTNGRVVLRGNAPSDSAKERAQSIAKATTDVVSVTNELVVGPTALESDAAALKDKMVAGTNNAVDVTKDKAAELKNDANRSMSDPNSSLNRTVDKVETKIDDAGINLAVNTGLTGDKELSSLKINVDVTNGKVVLKGPAPNAAAKARATDIAMGAKGVTSVDNQLIIQ